MTAAVAPSAEARAPRGETPERIALLTPTGRDAAVAAQVLENAGLHATPCDDMPALCRLVAEGVGAVLVAEEALNSEASAMLLAVLAEQPPWSDISVLLFAGTDRSQAALRTLHKLELLRNVTYRGA